MNLLNIFRATRVKQSPPPETYDYLDKQATVEEDIKPYCRGRVFYRSSTWFAVCPENITLSQGQTCLVLHLDTATLTLIVKPLNLDEIR